jgi:flavin reductase (DIM6/NTAB) family NADH-FMN oxidoreductase RutF
MELDPSALSPRERYALMIGAIQPRPIAWVSTVDNNGVRNLAPFSFFTGITASPMTLCFCPARNRDGKPKDTLANVLATQEFVVNAATEETAEKMVRTSFEFDPGEDEFEKAGLTAEPSALVKPARVKESPVALECRLHSTVTISEGPGGGTLVIGTVVGGRIDDSVLRDGRIRHDALKAIGRLEGSWYTKVAETFEIERPK